MLCRHVCVWMSKQHVLTSVVCIVCVVLSLDSLVSYIISVY